MEEQIVEQAVEDVAKLGMEAAHHGEALGNLLSIWTIVPFVLLLGCVAVLPLAAEHWWEQNRNKGIISLVLSIPVLAIFWHLGDFHPILHEAQEYVAFIVLLGSLFVVSGGIYLSGDIKATPLVNTTFLAVGGVLANLLGTTGASMVLIRPVLRTNSQRSNTAHIPIFFIFIVSNIAGCLLPIGDPPLFMGYLRGVPFFWTLRLLPQWLFMMALILGTFYVFDRRAYRREIKADIVRDVVEVEPLGLHGKINLLFLAGILGSVIYLPLWWREGAMILMGVLSMMFTDKRFRDKNEFNWAPIVEVAVLFAGIFVTMVPALQILHARGGELGVNEPWEFFWATGTLSSFLDNTPTYLVFFEMAKGLTASDPDMMAEIAGMPVRILTAISVGAVFMGAMTYIGNGPNFMVKAICEHQRVKMPSFFGYMLWSVGILVPLLIIVTFIFFVFS